MMHVIKNIITNFLKKIGLGIEVFVTIDKLLKISQNVGDVSLNGNNKRHKEK
jgi:hypothetical protein